MPKKIKCAKCGHKLFSLKGDQITSHGDNQIKIRDVGGKASVSRRLSRVWPRNARRTRIHAAIQLRTIYEH